MNVKSAFINTKIKQKNNKFVMHDIKCFFNIIMLFSYLFHILARIEVAIGQRSFALSVDRVAIEFVKAQSFVE